MTTKPSWQEMRRELFTRQSLYNKNFGILFPQRSRWNKIRRGGEEKSSRKKRAGSQDSPQRDVI